MADQSVSVPMTLSDLERPNALNQFFQADLNNAGTAWQNDKFDRITLNASRGLSATAEFLVWFMTSSVTTPV